MNQMDEPPPLPAGPTGRFTTDGLWRQRLRKNPHSDLPLLKAACLTSADGKTSHSIRVTPVNTACPHTKYIISDLLHHISFYIHAKMVSTDVFWYSRFKRNDILNIQATHIWYIGMYTKFSFRFHKNVYLWTRAGSGNNFNHHHRNRITGLASTVT
jgi:hypothetical protein